MLTLRLSDYGIDPQNGFLGSPPLQRLDSKYFSPWENLLDRLSHLLVAWRFREEVDKVIDIRTIRYYDIVDA